MRDSFTVSVLLPCRNAEATLDQALKSLVVQTMRDFEIIAVDDGSTDNTPHLMEQWARRDSRFRFHRTAPKGIVAALNSAADRARGEVFARMDADDISTSTRLEHQVDYLREHPELVACGTRIRYFPRHLVRDGAIRYEKLINAVTTPNEIVRDLFVECPIPHPSLMMRRSSFDAVGGYRDPGWPEDYDLIMRFWEAGYGIGKVPEVLVEWRESIDRLSRTDPRYDEKAFRKCKVNYLEKRLGARSIVVCGAGPVGKAFAVCLQESGHTVAAFVDLDPRKIGQTIHGASVVHPSAIGDYRDSYAIAAVGSAKGRAEIREMLSEAGFLEPDDFCAVA